VRGARRSPLVTIQFGAPTDRRPPYKFSTVTRVAFSDTDAQGVVYYGRYLPYCDQARVEYHRHLDLIGKRDVMAFAMRAQTTEYHAPARFDDLLEVFVRASRIGRTSIAYEFAAYPADSDELMMKATQTTVHVSKEGPRRAMPVPDELRDALVAFEGGDLELAS
jgi:acyl-CoA thioester hydrolase